MSTQSKYINQSIGMWILYPKYRHAMSFPSSALVVACSDITILLLGGLRHAWKLFMYVPFTLHHNVLIFTSVILEFWIRIFFSAPLHIEVCEALRLLFYFVGLDWLGFPLKHLTLKSVIFAYLFMRYCLQLSLWETFFFFKSQGFIRFSLISSLTRSISQTARIAALRVGNSYFALSVGKRKQK